jgi:hypothetical protein
MTFKQQAMFRARHNISWWWTSVSTVKKYLNLSMHVVNMLLTKLNAAVEACLPQCQELSH